MEAPAQADPRWLQPHYNLRRKILRLIGSSFYIYDQAGNLCFFVDQKGFKLKEDIRVYTDESKTSEVFTIRARSVIDFSAAYDVFDSATGQKLGMLKRHGWKSMARDEWDVCNAADIKFATLTEDSLGYALIRRLITNLLPQKYDLLIDNQLVVDFTQNFNPFSYHLNIDFTRDPQYRVDRRLGIAAAIMMAAIEGRQR